MAKVFVHYEEGVDEALHTTLKITLPKKWMNGPISKILKTFIDTYNVRNPTNVLDALCVHLETTNGAPLPSDALVGTHITDKSDMYVKPGKSMTAREAKQAEAGIARKTKTTSTAANAGKNKNKCMRFGCQKIFDPKTNTDESCRYHKMPPVFHETAKYWACCPTKKAYEWEEFIAIPGCCTGAHTTENQSKKTFLGGTDLRDAAAGVNILGELSKPQKLKTAADFNEEEAGAGHALPAVRAALLKLGVAPAYFDDAVNTLADRHGQDVDMVAIDLGKKFANLLNGVTASSKQVK